MNELHRWKAWWVAPLLMVLIGGGLGAQEPSESREDGGSAEAVVRELYALVTFEPGTTPDWDAVRALFLDEAVVVLRTSRTATTVFTLEGFVNDFVTFIERANAEETGFEETIVKLVPVQFHDMANVWVLYEARIPGSPRPPQQGVDSFSLIRQGDRWRIVSITNDIPSPEHPIPEILRP